MNPAWGKPWRLDQLPMIPVDWKYRVADQAEAQFKIISQLFSDSATTEIICATDAGREGEHIFRLIYQLIGCRKPVKRLWISSLTPEAIRAGFDNLQSSTEFDSLADAAAAPRILSSILNAPSTTQETRDAFASAGIAPTTSPPTCFAPGSASLTLMTPS